MHWPTHVKTAWEDQKADVFASYKEAVDHSQMAFDEFEHTFRDEWAWAEFQRWRQELSSQFDAPLAC